MILLRTVFYDPMWADDTVETMHESPHLRCHEPCDTDQPPFYRDQVLKQLVPVDELKTTERTNGLAGEARSRVNLVPQGGGHDPPQAPAPANAAPSPLLAPATARQPFPRPQLGPNARPLPLGVGITRGVAPNAATFMSLTPKSTFLVKEPMREVLKLVPGVPQDKMVFEYEEVSTSIVCLLTLNENYGFHFNSSPSC